MKAGIVALLVFALVAAPVHAQTGIWAMNAFNGEVPPGATGATIFFPWSELEPAPGVYQWGSIEAQLQMHADAGRPSSVLVTVSRSGWYDGRWLYVNDSPAHAGPTRLVPVGSSWTMRLPAYDDAGWKAELRTFVEELGRRYDNDPRVAVVRVIAGLDGETHAYKSSYEDLVVSALGTGFRPAFERFVKESLVWHDRCFIQTPLFLAANPGGQAFRKELIRSYLIPMAIGYGNHGLQDDAPTAWGPATYQTAGGNYALWAPMRDLSGLVDRWLESTTGVSTPESVYWALLLALQWRPAGIDLHKEWFAANPEAIAWANAYLADPGRGVWLVLRDREYGPVDASINPSSSMYLSGWPGDFEYGLVRTTEAPRVWRAVLPVECRSQIESRQARAFSGAMTLQVVEPAALGARVMVRVCYLDEDSAMVLQVGGVEWGLGGGGSHRFLWAVRSIEVPGDWDGRVLFSGGGTVHAVELLKLTPTPTSTPRPTAPPTVTASPTMTASPTTTPTPAPTACPGVLVLGFAERLGIRDTAGLWLYTTEPVLDWQNDQTLSLCGELGAPLSATFRWGPFTCRALSDAVVVFDERCQLLGAVHWDGTEVE